MISACIKLQTAQKLWSCFSNPIKTNIGDVKMTFWDCELLHLCSYCEDLGKFQAHFIDLVRVNWDNMTNYIEKDDEMLITTYFDGDLECIILTCKYFDIDFI